MQTDNTHICRSCSIRHLASSMKSYCLPLFSIVHKGKYVTITDLFPISIRGSNGRETWCHVPYSIYVDRRYYGYCTVMYTVQCDPTGVCSSQLTSDTSLFYVFSLIDCSNWNKDCLATGKWRLLPSLNAQHYL